MSVPATEAVQRARLDTGDLDLSKVSVRMMSQWMSRILGPDVAAVTLGDSIFVTSGKYQSVVAGNEGLLLAHELVHVDQWRREGTARFLSRYLFDYVRNRMIGLDHKVAYRAIGFEAAAFDVSERPDREIV